MKKKIKIDKLVFAVIKYCILSMFALVAVIPVVSCVFTAFKTTEAYQTTNVITPPENWLNFENFIKAFQIADMGRAFINSLIVMVCVLAVSIIVGTQLAYTASYVSGYEFVQGSGWKSKPSDDKSFQPYQLSFAYTNSSRTFKYWTDRISFAPTLSTSVVYDFLKPTSSYFLFNPGITFKINNFLDISFVAETRNNTIYRYFCSEDDYNFYYSGAGERSIFQDLKNSFRFDSDNIRRSSGFKMKTLKVKITHDLDDWDLNCEFSVTPRYVSATAGKSAYYDSSPYFSISVSWRPLSSMKTEIVDEYGEWQLNK